MLLATFLSFYSKLSSGIVCIWLTAWRLRKNADADYPFDFYGQILRISMIVLGFLVGYYSRYTWLRVFAGFFGLSFLCWPNFAHYLMVALAKLGMTQSSEHRSPPECR